MKRRIFQELPVVVENAAGSIRQWHDRDARLTGETVMKCDYGFIEDCMGSDGDEVDVYLGDDESAQFVYVIHQLKTPDYAKHDEDKCCIGFASEEAAKNAYLAHRNDGEKAYGGMSAIPLDAFRAKLERRTGSGKIRHSRFARGEEVSMSKLTLMRIEHRGSKWVVLPESGDKVLGTHDTKEDAETQLRAIEASKARHSIYARMQMFDALDTEGKVRSGVWDYICLEGDDLKDGQETSFNPETLSQFVENFAERGDLIPMDHNHQSNYASTNGKPAPALAWYGALAVAWDGKILKAGSARGIEPSGYEGIDLSKNGLFAYRSEVTPLGQELLPNYKYASPTFMSEGQRRDGSDCGYQLLAVAATNTPHQSGTQLTMEKHPIEMGFNISDKVRVEDHNGRVSEGEITRAEPRRGVMTAGSVEWMVKVGPREAWTPESVIKKMEKVQTMEPQWSAECSYCEKRLTVRADGTLINHRDKNGQECPGSNKNPRPGTRESWKPGSISHENSNKGAGKMSKLASVAKLIKMEGDADDAAVKQALLSKMEDTAMAAASEPAFNYGAEADKFEEMAKAYEDAHMEHGEDEEPLHMTMRKMAAKFRGLAKMGDPPFGGKETPSEEAAEEKAKMAKLEADDKEKGDAKLAVMEASLEATKEQLATLNAREEARANVERAEQERKYETLADAAIAGGFKADKKKALVSFARLDYDAARASIEHFLPKTGAPAHLFERNTRSGGPVGGDTNSRTDFAPLKPRRVYSMGHTFVETDSHFADEIKRVAESKDPIQAEKVDNLLAPAERPVMFNRLRVAERIVRAERPDLAKAAEGE